MRLRVGAATDVGRVRDLNEDAYVLRAEDGLFVVCDGMGGAPAGEVASRLAVESIAQRLNGAAPDGNRPHAGARMYLPHTARLAEAVRYSNECIWGRAQEDPRRAGMGTTVVGAWIRQHVAGVAHVGDSRAYLWHGRTLHPLTRDHALTGAQSHVLVRALGREAEVNVELTEVPVQPGDYILLCSDGLTRMVPEPAMADAFGLRDPQRICDHLIAAANRNGGADNITVVVVEVTGGWWRRLVSRWTRPARRGHDAEAYAAV